MKISAISFFVISGLIVLFVSFRQEHFLKNVFRTLIQGSVSLMAVNVLGLLTGVTIAVNWYTLLTVSVFGMPSTITMVLLDAFLK